MVDIVRSTALGLTAGSAFNCFNPGWGHGPLVGGLAGFITGVATQIIQKNAAEQPNEASHNHPLKTSGLLMCSVTLTYISTCYQSDCYDSYDSDLCQFEIESMLTVFAIEALTYLLPDFYY